MTRRIVMFLTLMLAPLTAQAELQLGLLGVYNRLPAELTAGPLTPTDALVGFEARAKIYIFQLGVTALVVPYTTGGAEALVVADTGFALDLGPVRSSIGFGPVYWVSLSGEYRTYLFGGVSQINMRIGLEAIFPLAAFGLVALWISDTADLLGLVDSRPVFGMTASIRLGDF